MVDSRCQNCAPVCKCLCGAPAMHVEILGQTASTGRCQRCAWAVSNRHHNFVEGVQRAEQVRARAIREATTNVVPISKARRAFDDDGGAS